MYRAGPRSRHILLQGLTNKTAESPTQHDHQGPGDGPIGVHSLLRFAYHEVTT